MQNKPDSLYADFEDAREDLRQYYRDTDREGFRFGCNDYPPFLSVNGTIDGPFAEMMEALAWDLGAKPVPTRCQWSDFAEGLARREFATVADPIMAIHLRAFQVIPLVQLYCGALFFTASFGPKIKADLRYHTRRIFQNMRKINRDGAISDQLEGIDNELRSIANIGRGFAVGRNFFEQSLLQRCNAPIARELPGPSLMDDAQEAAQEYFLCVMDLTSVRQIEAKIGRDSFKALYDYIPLFGKYITLPAGLPFVDRDIGRYLWYRWRHEKASPILQALKKLTPNDDSEFTTPRGFDIIDPFSLPVDMSQALLTTRSIEYYIRISELIQHAAYPDAKPRELSPSPGQLKLLSGSPGSPIADRAFLPIPSERVEDLRAVLLELDEGGGGGIRIRTVREAIHEESAARNYVRSRYHDLIDRKHLGTLSDRESEELEKLTEALDEMDEMFYESIIEKLRAAVRAKEEGE